VVGKKLTGINGANLRGF